MYIIIYNIYNIINFFIGTFVSFVMWTWYKNFTWHKISDPVIKKIKQTMKKNSGIKVKELFSSLSYSIVHDEGCLCFLVSIGRFTSAEDLSRVYDITW